MDKKTAIEINTLSKKVNSIIQTIDNFFHKKCEENKQEIVDTQDALCESSTDTEMRLSDIEDALCELSEFLESEE